MATEKRERQRANRQLKNQYQRQAQRRQTTTRRLVIGAVAVAGGLLVVLALAWFGGAFSGGDDDAADTELTSPSVAPATSTAESVPAGEQLPNGFQLGVGACPPEGVEEPVRSFDGAPQLCIDPESSYTATIGTSEGDIVVELDTASTPGTVNNFVTLARFGYYDETLIFRADPSIEIVQGGGTDNLANPGYTIPDEGSRFTYEEGQIVMARTGAPNSAGGQWFIVTGPAASNLDADGTYVVFGTVTEGLEIAQEMVAGAGGPDGQTPAEEVSVETVTITEDAAGATATTPATVTDTTETTVADSSAPSSAPGSPATSEPTATTSGG
ncbi:MAG: peptidylprolyl isomerase [Actinomycetota bacterium]|nr:peptidylprolyl isomerase [Actinomycetota bacterium]